MLNNSRWLLLKWRANLSEKQVPKLEERVSLNLRTVTAYLLKEEFQQLWWDCRSANQAKKFLNRWRQRAVRSKIQPMMKVAKMLKTHWPLPFLGHCGRHEQQGEDGPQKRLQVPLLQGLRTRFISYTWQSAGTRDCPQVLLEIPICLSGASRFSVGLSD